MTYMNFANPMLNYGEPKVACIIVTLPEFFKSDIINGK